MDKSWIVKTPQHTAVTTVILISIYGSTLKKKLFEDISAADREAIQQSGNVEYIGFGEPGVYANDAVTDAIKRDAGMAQVMDAMSDNQCQIEQMQVYADYGLTYSTVNGAWWFKERPLAGLHDPTYHSVHHNHYRNIGAYLLAEREVTGKLKRLREVSREEFILLSGLGEGSPLAEESETHGINFYTEDISVYGMDDRQFAACRQSLYTKYRKQHAIVQCKDYVFLLEKEDMLKLSSFCGAEKNPFGVTLYADYNIADEMDTAVLDTIKIDYLLLEMLTNNRYENAQDVEADAKKTIAEHYNISTHNLVAAASLI